MNYCSPIRNLEKILTYINCRPNYVGLQQIDANQPIKPLSASQIVIKKYNLHLTVKFGCLQTYHFAAPAALQAKFYLEI